MKDYKVSITTKLKTPRKGIVAIEPEDYTMAEAGGVTDFVRKYTLAEGGPYCDCGYKQRKK